VHVHTKWTDAAGHKKSPSRKRDVIELLDAAVAPHVDGLLASGAVVCLTTDHQTPSSGPLYHSGGSVPVAIAGGVAGRDDVARFSERGCDAGTLGPILGSDLMPLLLDCADRSAFLAERYTAEPCLGTAAPDRVVPLAPMEADSAWGID
jgi:2,3-bisphosphoglycerate-independent phosphoglycerate mutase